VGKSKENQRVERGKEMYKRKRWAKIQEEEEDDDEEEEEVEENEGLCASRSSTTYLLASSKSFVRYYSRAPHNRMQTTYHINDSVV
jgi:hypothetical protein